MHQSWEKNAEIEFNKEILWENEETMNTLCLFKEPNCFLKTEYAKNKPYNMQESLIHHRIHPVSLRSHQKFCAWLKYEKFCGN